MIGLLVVDVLASVVIALETLSRGLRELAAMLRALRPAMRPQNGLLVGAVDASLQPGNSSGDFDLAKLSAIGSFAS